MSNKGNHLIVDIRRAPYELCVSDKSFLSAIASSAERAGANVISQVRYKFDGKSSPEGFTAVILLDESHCSVHTYANEGLIALDIFTCGNTDPQVVFEYIKDSLNFYDYKNMEINIRNIERFIVE